MRIGIQSQGWRRTALAVALWAAALAVPATVQAQFDRPRVTPPAIGEDYHVEVAGNFWNPSLLGIISSEQFGIIGSDIDFVRDLGFEQTRFRDLRIVLRPGRKHRFRLQYTPVQYTSDTTFDRTIVFNGIAFPVSLPVAAQFEWKVWRLGYEYDVYYTSRGFVGILFDVRQTRMTASLATPVEDLDEYTTATAPLPALGVVGRAYVLPEVAINFEVSTMRLPEIDPKYQANYFDWDIHGTFNFNNYVGLQVGWRRVTTFLAIENDKGDLKFQGLWFGAAVRY